MEQKRKRGLQKKIPRLSDQEFSFFNAAYKARTTATLSHRSTQCARIGLEENSCLMVIVDGGWYAQPPDDKRSDDKAASAASGLGRAMKIRPPQLATWSVPSTNPPEEKNERGRDPAE